MGKNQTIRTVLMATGIVLAPASVWAQQSEPHRYGPHMMNWGGGWYGMIFGPIMMILFLAIVIALVVLLVRWLGGPWQATRSSANMQSGPSPLDILKERFARGEIDKKEFEERRNILE